MRDFFTINRINLSLFYLFTVFPFAGFLAQGVNFQGLVLLFTLAIVYLMFILKGSLNYPRYLVYFTLFTIYAIISDVTLASKEINIKYIYTNGYLGGIATLFIIENLPIPRQDYKNYFKISVVVLYIAFLVIVIQQFVNSSFFAPSSGFLEDAGEEKRLPSIYAWIGSSALLGVCFFPILGIVIEDRFRNPAKNRDLLVLFIMGALAALFNKSRFIMLNYLFLLLLIPIYKGFRLNTFIKYSTIVLGSAFILYFGSKAVNYDIDKLISERILETDKGGLQHGSASTRLVAFEVFGKLFPKYAVWGKGRLHSFGPSGSKDYELVKTIAGRSSQIHVGYLSLFYYYGLVGGGIYMLFLVSLSRKLYKDAKFHGRWGPFIGWVMFLVSNLTLVMLDIYVMGLILIFLFNSYYVQEAKERQLNPQLQ